MSIPIEISPGELIDRLTILEIKAARIGDAARRRNVRHELALTRAARDRYVPAGPDIERLHEALREVNESLWLVEDELRDHERRGEFDERFVELARRVYFTNDRRAALKREINVLLASSIIEEKSYATY